MSNPDKGTKCIHLLLSEAENALKKAKNAHRESQKRYE
jgi:hypothetical protein